MLIWKGHGILILVFAVVGALLTGMAVAAGYAATHWEWMLRMVKPANVWGAALAIWLYGRTIGKTVIKTYVDPATRRQVMVKTSHTLFFIPATPWAVLVALMACVSTVESFNKPVDDLVSEMQPAGSSPGSEAFKVANGLIDSDRGRTAYGNTPDAEKLAEAFSQMVMKGREMGVQKARSKSTISLSHGKFLSYCRINPDSCVFMVHVPDLRKFSSDAKKYMVDMAWTVAGIHAAQLQPRPRRLAVGVRGAFLYDEMVEGSVPDAHAIAANEANENWEAGIERRFSGSNATKRLETYFEPQAPDVVLPTLGDPRIRADFDQLTKRFEKMQPGQADGNVPAAKELATAYAKAVRDVFSPAFRDQVPQFSGYVHLRHDTAAFLLGMPGEGQLPPGGFVLLQPHAWKIAVTAAEQMTPKPARIALLLFLDGQLVTSFLGAPQGSAEEEIDGTSQQEHLLPFFSPAKGEMIAVKAPAAASGPTTPVPSPLPTAVRDWKDTTGRVMQASLESFTASAKDTGRFKRADGQVFEVPFTRLSAEDQAFIREIAAQVKP